MGSKLARMLAPVILSAGMLFSQGCIDEPNRSSAQTQTNQRDPQDIGHEVPAEVIDIYGSWYKKPEGQSSTWAWHWGNLTLSQNGKKLSGYEKWERYPRSKVEGWIEGEVIHLEAGKGTNILYYLDGFVHDNGNSMTLNEYWPSSQNKITKTYHKISDNFNDGHDPVSVLRGEPQ
jgi:hypothetical protein